MTTKIPFLLKQTAEQRAQLDEMAADTGLSRTELVQRLLDAQWSLKHSELSRAMVDLSDAVQKAYATDDAQVTKAPPADDPDGLLAPTPCACDGNCMGCGKGAA